MKLLIIDNDPEAVELVELPVGMTWPEATMLSACNGDEGIGWERVRRRGLERFGPLWTAPRSCSRTFHRWVEP